MNYRVVSKSNSLRLIPVEYITRFGMAGTTIYMRHRRNSIDANAVPGTIEFNYSGDDGGIIKKQISFQRSDVGRRTMNLLEVLKGVRLVAVYYDEMMMLRVAGSPSRPLSLDYSCGEGVYNVELTGSDTCQDGFLEERPGAASPSARARETVNLPEN